MLCSWENIQIYRECWTKETPYNTKSEFIDKHSGSSRLSTFKATVLFNQLSPQSVDRKTCAPGLLPSSSWVPVLTRCPVYSGALYPALPRPCPLQPLTSDRRLVCFGSYIPNLPVGLDRTRTVEGFHPTSALPAKLSLIKYYHFILFHVPRRL